jgi:hypothetical protein
MGGFLITKMFNDKRLNVHYHKDIQTEAKAKEFIDTVGDGTEELVNFLPYPTTENDTNVVISKLFSVESDIQINLELLLTDIANIGACYGNKIS